MAHESESLASEVASLAQEYIDRCRAGERPSVERYAEEHPEFAEKIREVFPMLLMMEDLAAPPEIEPSLEVESFGDFEIHRELGRGGMGTVYEATQRSLGRRVALKVCPITQTTSNLVERFRRESRAAALLHHSNIAPVFAVGEEQGFLFYCMQLIEGATLDSVIAELRRAWHSDPGAKVRIDPALILHSRAAEGDEASDAEDGNDPVGHRGSTKSTPRSGDRPAKRDGPSAHDSANSESGTGAVYWDSVARIGVQVADALAYAHGKGTLHRDIKPSNLMLDESGMVWVLDFGLAKTTVEDDLTRSGEMIGTLRYMPPEQSTGNATELSDVYSLGLTLYELLTFRPAFEAVNRSELIRAVAESDPPAPRRINSRVPRDLETIILKACEREPAKRYESARAMQEDLNRFLDRQPIRARPISIAGRVAKWVKRRPLVAALLLTLAVVFSGSFALVTWKWREAEWQRVRAVSLADSERKARLAERDQFDTTNEVNDFLAKILRSARPEAAGESVRVIDVMDALESEIDQRFADRPRIRGLIRREFGSTYRELGDESEAVNQFRESVAALEQVRPLDELELLNSQDKLAGALRSLGGSERIDEAEKLRRVVVERRADLLGADHPLTARAKGNLGVVLDEKGDLAGAREMLEQSLNSMRLDPEADPIELITCRHNLISLMDREGNTEEAISAMEILIAETADRPKDESILVQLSQTLALMCQSCGKLDESESAFRVALEDYTQFYGESHPKTLSTMRKLCRLLVDNDKASAAIKLLYSCVELHNEFIGPGAGLTFGVRKYVVRAHEQLGETQRAREFLAETVEVLASERGDDHRYTREAQELLKDFDARHP